MAASFLLGMFLGRLSAVNRIGVLVMTPRFTSCPPAYHTHLAGLARTVSLHRTSSPAADSPTR